VVYVNLSVQYHLCMIDTKYRGTLNNVGNTVNFYFCMCHILTDVRCPGLDWYEFGDFCYKPSMDKKTWHDAQKACRTVGRPLTKHALNFLCFHVSSAETSDVWTGLNDLEFTGFFTWSDRHLVSFTYWAPGEPNNHDGFSEDCVEMLQTTGRWNDVSCTELNTYICKIPKAHYPVPSVQPTEYGCPQV
uniref:C-type lectin domain-containing protein n=1 Tax=Neogobius melanostomus TaxID=47308 RepID=A0A8C6SAE1_9GOBI